MLFRPLQLRNFIPHFRPRKLQKTASPFLKFNMKKFWVKMLDYQTQSPRNKHRWRPWVQPWPMILTISIILRALTRENQVSTLTWKTSFWLKVQSSMDLIFLRLILPSIKSRSTWKSSEVWQSELPMCKCNIRSLKMRSSFVRSRNRWANLLTETRLVH